MNEVIQATAPSEQESPDPCRNRHQQLFYGNTSFAVMGYRIDLLALYLRSLRRTYRCSPQSSSCLPNDWHRPFATFSDGRTDPERAEGPFLEVLSPLNIQVLLVRVQHYSTIEAQASGNQYALLPSLNRSRAFSRYDNRLQSFVDIIRSIVDDVGTVDGQIIGRGIVDERHNTQTKILIHNLFESCVFIAWRRAP